MTVTGEIRCISDTEHTAKYARIGHRRALGLGLCLLLTSCSGDADARLTGNYVEDTVAVSRSLREVIDLPQDDPSHAEAEKEARGTKIDVKKDKANASKKSKSLESRIQNVENER